jgi:replicative DNA helicase
MVGNHASEDVFSLDVGKSDTRVIDKMDKAWQEIADLPLWIIAHPMAMPDIMATSHLLKSRFDVDIIFIDHIQFILPYQLPGTNRNNTIAAYSQQIVGIAKTLDVAVVVASQLSRDAEKSNRPPRMSDLRDSGTIEQDARQIVLLYWDNEVKHHIINVAKNNYGIAREDINVRRLDGRQRFEEIVEVVDFMEGVE